MIYPSVCCASLILMIVSRPAGDQISRVWIILNFLPWWVWQNGHGQASAVAGSGGGLSRQLMRASSHLCVITGLYMFFPFSRRSCQRVVSVRNQSKHTFSLKLNLVTKDFQGFYVSGWEAHWKVLTLYKNYKKKRKEARIKEAQSSIKVACVQNASSHTHTHQVLQWDMLRKHFFLQ